MGIFGSRVRVNINDEKIMAGIDKTLKDIFAQAQMAESLQSMTKSAEVFVQQTGTLANTLAEFAHEAALNVFELRLFVQDSVKRLEPFFILLLISITLFFFASAWRRFQPRRNTTVLMIMSNQRETGDVDQLIEGLRRRGAIENDGVATFYPLATKRR